MEDKISLLNELNKAGDKELVMKMLLEQLEKDLGEFGLHPDFKSVNLQNLDVLIELLSIQLKKMEGRTGNQLLSLFYRIDVPADIIHRASEKPQSERFSFLALEVLNRELKKVITRLAYRHFNE